MKNRLMLKAILFAALLLTPPIFCAQITDLKPSENHKQITLWPSGAPGSANKSTVENVRITTPDGEHIVSNVHSPSITPYIPSKEKSTGHRSS